MASNEDEYVDQVEEYVTKKIVVDPGGIFDDGHATDALNEFLISTIAML